MSKANTIPKVCCITLAILLIISLLFNFKKESEIAKLNDNYTKLLQSQEPKNDNESEELLTKIESLKEANASFNKTIDELQKNNKNSESEIASLKKASNSFSETIKELQGKNEKYESKIAELSNLNRELNSERSALNNQLLSVKNELETQKQTFTVFYVDGTGKEIYSEQVLKGKDVQNVPTIPTKGTFSSNWISDGKNIQKSQVIYPEYYHLLTFKSIQEDGNDVLSLSTNSYKLREDATVTLSSSTISIGDTVIVTSTVNEAYSYYNLTGWFIDDDLVNSYGVYANLDFNVTDDVVFTADAYEGCILKGSKIAMAEGDEKNVEDLKVGDLVLSYNYYAGKIQARPVLSIVSGSGIGRILSVTLENGRNIKIVDYEMLFDVDTKEFFPINITTAESSIGRNVMINNNGEIASSKIASIDITTAETEHYTVYTTDSIDYIANGIVALTQTYYPNMRYEIGDDFKINEEKYLNDIATYGLFKYSELSDLISEELFDALHIEDMKFAVGKGIIDMDKFRNALRALQKEYDTHNH